MEPTKQFEEILKEIPGYQPLEYGGEIQHDRSAVLEAMLVAYNLGRESKPDDDDIIGTITSDLVGKYSVEEAIYEYWTGTEKRTYRGIIKAVYDINPLNINQEDEL